MQAWEACSIVSHPQWYPVNHISPYLLLLLLLSPHIVAVPACCSCCKSLHCSRLSPLAVLLCYASWPVTSVFYKSTQKGVTPKIGFIYPFIRLLSWQFIRNGKRFIYYFLMILTLWHIFQNGKRFIYIEVFTRDIKITCMFSKNIEWQKNITFEAKL